MSNVADLIEREVAGMIARLITLGAEVPEPPKDIGFYDPRLIPYARVLRDAVFLAEFDTHVRELLRWMDHAATPDLRAKLRERDVPPDFLIPVDGVPVWLLDVLAAGLRARY